jgi:hypothetical protein
MTETGRESPPPQKIMQGATDERSFCCGEDDSSSAATQRSLAMDRLQALLGLEGDYYCNGPPPPPPMMMPTASSSNGAAALHHRRPPRRRTRAAGFAGANGGFDGCSATHGGGGRASTTTLAFRCYLAQFSESRGRVCSWAYGGTSFRRIARERELRSVAGVPFPHPRLDLFSCPLVVDYFGLSRGIVGWMMYYMDRVLSSQRSLEFTAAAGGDGDATSSSDFLLLSVAAFYLAMKLVGGGGPSHDGGGASHDGRGWELRNAGHHHHHRHPPRHLPMSVILELSKYRFTTRQISQAEFRILQALEWRVHPPTPDQYVFDLVDLCCGPSVSAREDVFDCTVYLIELSVVNHYFLEFVPSEIVVAAMHNARNLTMRKSSSNVGGDSGVTDGSGDIQDDEDDDDDCVILPTNTPADFTLEPMQVLPGIDPLRVAWCRFRLSEILEQQQARKQQQEQHASNRRSAPAVQPNPDASVLRTCSPVSVHPRDPANAAQADPGVLGGAAKGLGGPSGKTDGEEGRHASS